MRAGLLLDTHTVLWWLTEPDRLAEAAHAAMADPTARVVVSAASGWEIATKVRPGARPAAVELLSDLPDLLAGQGFELLPIQLRHGRRAGNDPMAQRDPSDRLLAAPLHASAFRIAPAVIRTVLDLSCAQGQAAGQDTPLCLSLPFRLCPTHHTFFEGLHEIDRQARSDLQKLADGGLQIPGKGGKRMS